MSVDTVRSTYRRMLDAYGEIVVLRRYTGLGAARKKRDYAVQARVTGYRPDELVGTIAQGDRKIIMMNEDVEASSFRLPLKKGDKVVVRDKELNIETADDSSRRVGEELIAYEIQARG